MMQNAIMVEMENTDYTNEPKCLLDVFNSRVCDWGLAARLTGKGTNCDPLSPPPTGTDPSRAQSPVPGAHAGKDEAQGGSSGRASIFVAVRVRPVNEGERGKGAWETIQVFNDKVVTLFDPKDKTSKDPMVRSRGNGVFHSPMIILPQWPCQLYCLNCFSMPAFLLCRISVCV